jgi:rhomboid protease GluP
MRLDVASLSAGEWWRLITPLFVQPYGWVQFVFNILFLAVFLPMAERLYGTKVWLLFLGTGLAGQLVNIHWRPGGGGSSTAAFGIMGTVLAYVLLRCNSAPQQYRWFAVLGILGGVVMCFNRDGHGAGVLSGAALAGLICWLSDGKHHKAL